MVTVTSHVLPLSDRRFFVRVALVMAAVAFVGFAPTYYLSTINTGAKPTLNAAVHIHGGLCTAWILLLIVQTQLVAFGRGQVHKRLGFAGIAIALATVVMGVFVALNSQRRTHGETTKDTLADPYVFLIFPLTSVLLFACFATLGVVKRHRPDAHKRFMLLATANLVLPALARMVNHATKALGITGIPGVVGATLLLNVFLVALAIHDFRSRGRLHPVTLWGGAFIVLSEPVRFVIGFSEPWQAFARALMT